MLNLWITILAFGDQVGPFGLDAHKSFLQVEVKSQVFRCKFKSCCMPHI